MQGRMTYGPIPASPPRMQHGLRNGDVPPTLVVGHAPTCIPLLCPAFVEAGPYHSRSSILMVACGSAAHCAPCAALTAHAPHCLSAGPACRHAGCWVLDWQHRCIGSDAVAQPTARSLTISSVIRQVEHHVCLTIPLFRRCHACALTHSQAGQACRHAGVVRVIAPLHHCTSAK